MKYYEFSPYLGETEKSYIVTNGKFAGDRKYIDANGITRSERLEVRKFIPKSQTIIKEVNGAKKYFVKAWLVGKNDLWNFVYSNAAYTLEEIEEMAKGKEYKYSVNDVIEVDAIEITKYAKDYKLKFIEAIEGTLCRCKVIALI